MAERFHPEQYSITIGEWPLLARPHVARSVLRPAFDDGYGGPLGALVAPWIIDALCEAVILAYDQYTIALTSAEELHRDLERCLGTDEPLRVRNACGPKAPRTVFYSEEP